MEIKQIKNFDKIIDKHQGEWDNLENEEVACKKRISNMENGLRQLIAKSAEEPNPELEKMIKNVENKLNDFEESQSALEIQLSHKNESISELKTEKDELVKRSLIRLYSKIKKDHENVNKDYERYIKLSTRAREERHGLESKMMNLRLLIYKNYNVRLME